MRALIRLAACCLAADVPANIKSHSHESSTETKTRITRTAHVHVWSGGLRPSGRTAWQQARRGARFTCFSRRRQPHFSPARIAIGIRSLHFLTG